MDLDAAGDPHIASKQYRYPLSSPLRMAVRQDGSWIVQTIYDSGTPAIALTGLAMILDAQGHSYVVLDEDDVSDPYGVGVDVLSLLTDAGGSWVRRVLTETAYGFFDGVSVARDSLGGLGICYGWRPAAPNRTNYAHTEVLPSGGWAFETIDPEGASLTNSIAFDKSANPHLLYVIGFGSPTKLKYAVKTGGIWTREIVASLARFYSCSMVLDQANRPHIAYRQELLVPAPSYSLKYGKRTNGVWTLETVDAGGSSFGAYASLAIDPDGNPHISYLDRDRGDLKYAWKAGGAWYITLVDSAGTSGYFTRLKLDQAGMPRIAYYSNATLKYSTAKAIAIREEAAFANAAAPPTAMSAFPNPCGDELAQIRFSAPAGACVRIDVFDVSGRMVRSLVTSAASPVGSLVTWDSRDARGERVAPGVYFLRLESGSDRETHRLVLLK